jgi:multiple sugar transport system substrate-binding protein
MITLRAATWQNPRGYDPLVVAADLWHSQHPQISVEWHQFPWYDFENHVLGRTGTDFDLVMFDHPWTGTLAHSRIVAWDSFLPPGYLSDLHARVVAPSTESYQRDRKLWALPLDASCHSGLYRADLLQHEQLPVFWEDIPVFARENHRPPIRFGLVLSVEGVLGHCLFLSMMAGLGHPPYLVPENPTCDRSAAEYVLTIIMRLLAFTPPGSHRWGPWDIYRQIVAHDDLAYSPSIFAYVNYFGPRNRERALCLCQVPSFRGHSSPRPILGGVGLGITSTSVFQRESAAFGMFLMDELTQRELFPVHHGQPATLSVWTDEKANAATNGFYRALLESMHSAYIRPTYYGFHELELSGGYILQELWDGKITLQNALDQLCQPYIRQCGSTM